MNEENQNRREKKGLSRKEFLGLSGLGIAGAVLLPDTAAVMAKPKRSSQHGVVAPAVSPRGPWRNRNYRPRPGHWQDYLLSPASRTIRSASVLFARPRSGSIEGDPRNILRTDGRTVTLKSSGDRTKSPLLAVDFGQEVSGKVILRVLSASSEKPELHVSFSESKEYMALEPGQNDGETAYAPGSDTANIWNGYPGFPYTWDSDSHRLPYEDAELPVSITDDQLRGGFRYATIFLDGPGSVTLDSIALEFTAAPKQNDLRGYQGYFLCDDNLLNKIWYAGVYTVQIDTSAPDTAKSWPYQEDEHDHADAKVPHANQAQEVIFDGGKRDRIVWQGDLAVQAPVTYLSTYDLPAVENSLSSLAAQQLPDGYVPAESLVGQHNYDEERTYGEYVTWFVYNMAEHYLYTGDKAYLDRWYSALKKAMGWLEGVRRQDSGGLIAFGSSGSCGHYGYSDCGHETYVNALYYRNLNQMVNLARAEGDIAAQKAYRSAAAEVKGAINRELWDDSVGAYRLSRETPSVYPQDANATAILTGVADMDQARRALAYLREHNWAEHGSLTVPQNTQGSPIPTMYEPLPSGFEVEARLASNEDDSALRLIRTFWGYQLSKDPESTFWEKANPDGKPGIEQFTSLAHGWASGPTIALTTQVLGVRPKKAGFSKYEAVPHPGDLKWAEGRVPTPRGIIKFRWSHKAHGRIAFTERLRAPRGTTGRVGVPTFGRRISVFVDGELAWDGKQPKAYGAHSDGAYVYLEGISGGSHEIESHPAGSPASVRKSG